MELNKKESDKCYKLAQEINSYNEEEDGCYWGNVLEVVQRAYKIGKSERSYSYRKAKEALNRLRSRA